MPDVAKNPPQKQTKKSNHNTEMATVSMRLQAEQSLQNIPDSVQNKFVGWAFK